MRFGVEDLGFIGFVASLRVDGLLPGGRVVESIAPDARGYVVVVDFPHTRGVPAAILKLLGERDRIWHCIAEMGIEIVDLNLIRAEAGHHRGAGWVTERDLVVGPFEAYAGAGKAINVRRFGHRVAVTAEGAGQVVHGDEEHIRPVGGLQHMDVEQSDHEGHPFHVGILQQSVGKFNAGFAATPRRRNNP
jgi:hypothetical protein